MQDVITHITCQNFSSQANYCHPPFSIRLKTTRQLKSIFDETSTVFDASLDKDGLQQLSFETNLMEKYWKLHPDKRPKPKVDDTPPSGDFSRIQDPVKRRALESLKCQGNQHLYGRRSRYVIRCHY